MNTVQEQVQNLPPIPTALARPKNNRFAFWLGSMSIYIPSSVGLLLGIFLFEGTTRPTDFPFNYVFISLFMLVGPRGETLMPRLYPVSEYLTDLAKSLPSIGRRKPTRLALHINSDQDGENEFYFVNGINDILVSSRLIRYSSPKALEYMLIRRTRSPFSFAFSWLYSVMSFALAVALVAFFEYVIRPFWPAFVVLILVLIVVYFPLKERQDKKQDELDIEAFRLVGDLEAATEAIYLLSACERSATRNPNGLRPPELRVAKLTAAIEAERTINSLLHRSDG
jgi:hypothetical protein